MDSYDYNAKSKDEVTNAFRKTLDKLSRNTKAPYISAQNGLAPFSTQATGDILDYLVEKGYKIVTLEECLKVKTSTSGTINKGNSTRNLSKQSSGSDSIYQGNLAMITVASTMIASAIMTLLF